MNTTEEHRERGEDRPRQGLVDGGVDDVRQRLAPCAVPAPRFSRMRSNTTIVSLMENPTIVRSAARTGRDISRLAIERAASATSTSWISAMMAATRPGSRTGARCRSGFRHARQHRVDRLQLQVSADLGPDELESAHLEARQPRLLDPCCDPLRRLLEASRRRGIRMRYSWASPNSWMTLSPMLDPVERARTASTVVAPAGSAPAPACRRRSRCRSLSPPCQAMWDSLNQGHDQGDGVGPPPLADEVVLRVDEDLEHLVASLVRASDGQRLDAAGGPCRSGRRCRRVKKTAVNRLATMPIA